MSKYHPLILMLPYSDNYADDGEIIEGSEEEDEDMSDS